MNKKKNNNFYLAFGSIVCIRNVIVDCLVDVESIEIHYNADPIDRRILLHWAHRSE